MLVRLSLVHQAERGDADRADGENALPRVNAWKCMTASKIVTALTEPRELGWAATPRMRPPKSPLSRSGIELPRSGKSVKDKNREHADDCTSQYDGQRDARLTVKIYEAPGEQQ